ncbi:High-affinity branched-chain amino acid transport ATP-binding protein LivF [Pararobbsia alpina]|uniref:High-affinity branched-chain amino acid transport ATP-binding protein LivF n=2 Tax=Pararobbsia alpina TaxID=621374 RepID=A0A6S7BN79_9BURK|nr:High-affinity branched-chain amino acid transport ATP-binding protein LivF [Pararobbsia alpina]
MLMSERPPVLLEVRNLQAGYGASQVLFGIDMDIPDTGCVVVLGRNGAGKSTLLKTLTGELRASAGSIAFGQRVIDGLPVHERVRAGMGYVPQENLVFSRLTVRENLQIGVQTRVERDISAAFDYFPKLGTRLNQLAGTLSGGERKMLSIARALLARPSLLLLDEPTEGVWIGVIEEIAEQLVRLAREMAIVLVEQHLELALRVATRAYVMDRGAIVLEDDPVSLRVNPLLVELLTP